MKGILISIAMVMALAATSVFAESAGNPAGGAAASINSLASVSKSPAKKKKHHKKKHSKKHGSAKKGTATPK